MTTKKKILVIDDDPNLVVYLTTLLGDHGYSTVSAKDGKEGLEKIQSEKPDLVLLDITMPEKSGVRFYRDLKENPATKARLLKKSWANCSRRWEFGVRFMCRVLTPNSREKARPGFWILAGQICAC